jgi:hypothetical protein
MPTLPGMSDGNSNTATMAAMALVPILGFGIGTLVIRRRRMRAACFSPCATTYTTGCAPPLLIAPFWTLRRIMMGTLFAVGALGLGFGSLRMTGVGPFAKRAKATPIIVPGPANYPSGCCPVAPLPAATPAYCGPMYPVPHAPGVNPNAPINTGTRTGAIKMGNVGQVRKPSMMTKLKMFKNNMLYNTPYWVNSPVVPVNNFIAEV